MTPSMTELTRTYARRVLDTLTNPAIRTQAQVVLRSPEMATLTGMVRSSLRGEPPSLDPGDAPAADATSPGDQAVNPLQQPTEDFAVSPTLVLDRADLDERRGIPDWVLPTAHQK